MVFKNFVQHSDWKDSTRECCEALLSHSSTVLGKHFENCHSTLYRISTNAGNNQTYLNPRAKDQKPASRKISRRTRRTADEYHWKLALIAVYFSDMEKLAKLESNLLKFGRGCELRTLVRACVRLCQEMSTDRPEMNSCESERR